MRVRVCVCIGGRVEGKNKKRSEKKNIPVPRISEKTRVDGVIISIAAARFTRVSDARLVRQIV